MLRNLASSSVRDLTGSYRCAIWHIFDSRSFLAVLRVHDFGLKSASHTYCREDGRWAASVDRHLGRQRSCRAVLSSYYTHYRVADSRILHGFGVLFAQDQHRHGSACLDFRIGFTIRIPSISFFNI